MTTEFRPLTRQALKQWCNNEFRDAALDDERILRAAAVLEVGVDSADCSGIEALRRAIVFFVVDLIEPEVTQKDGEEKATRKPQKVKLWLARDDDEDSEYELYTTKPQTDSAGWFWPSDNDRLGRFCCDSFEYATGYKLKLGECRQGTIRIENV